MKKALYELKFWWKKNILLVVLFLTNRSTYNLMVWVLSTKEGSEAARKSYDETMLLPKEEQTKVASENLDILINL